MTDPALTTDGLSILIVGSGAREHALAWALRQSPAVSALFAAPGNPGLAEIAERVPIPEADVERLAAWATEHAVDLVVVGPEAPLAAGLADRLLARGVRVFGPSLAAAELEWSKAFAKRFLAAHRIPTAAAAVFDDPAAALRHAARLPYPLVVKADGLAAGRGVAICQTPAAADRAIRAAMTDGAFGRAGERVVIEEFLEGEEVSVIALVDGERFATLVPARDYKRLGDGDRGPNTGGMGSYAPSAAVDAGLLAEIEATVLRPTVEGMRRWDRPYQGALFVGLMLTAAGPKVLEFNCRFGDPEAQVILPLLDGDLAHLLLTCADSCLDPAAVRVRPGAAVCVTLAAAGYPKRPEVGRPIRGINEAAAIGAHVFHAATARQGDALVTAGGRVLSVMAGGDSRAEAAVRAYAAADLIAFDGCQMRRDVAADAPVPR